MYNKLVSCKLVNLQLVSPHEKIKQMGDIEP